jgi:type I restriction enzyme S subunit
MGCDSQTARLTTQARITTEVDRLFSLAQVESTAAGTASRRCQRLRQAILKWAFEGRLVEQDPNDEPASMLLERIRLAREATDNGAAPRPVRRARRKRGAS